MKAKEARSAEDRCIYEHILLQIHCRSSRQLTKGSQMVKKNVDVSVRAYVEERH